ncbi:unnamed protein product, partial [Nesidiocoris tenuis]
MVHIGYLLSVTAACWRLTLGYLLRIEIAVSAFLGLLKCFYHWKFSCWITFINHSEQFLRCIEFPKNKDPRHTTDWRRRAVGPPPVPAAAALQSPPVSTYCMKMSGCRVRILNLKKSRLGPSAVRRPPSAVRRPPSAIRHPSSAVHRPPSTIRRPPYKNKK